jgi:hypothetical protein
MYEGSRTPPLATGMRLASVGLAAALAFAVFLDVGGIVDDGSTGSPTGGDESAEFDLASAAMPSGETSEERIQDSLGEADDSGDDDSAAAPVPEETKIAEDQARSTPAPVPGGAAGGAATVAAPDAPADGSEGDNAATEAPGVAGQSLEIASTAGGGEEEAPANGDADLVSIGSADDDSGSSTLLIVEIVLAAALIAALIGSLALARVRKL